MTKFKFSNRASSLITATVVSNATAVQLETGGGLRMPVLAFGDVFRATMIDGAGASEIVTATAVVADVVTVIRGQEGTAARTFASGSRFEVRMTAGIADSFLQRSGDTMLGDLDLDGHKLLDADLSETAVRFDTYHANFWRAASTPLDQPYAASENAIYIPPDTNANFDARRPGYMGRVITNSQMFDGIVFDWFGNINNLPSHLKLCDGTNGTPDLRGKYIKGWTATFGVGGEGGVPEINPSQSLTSAAGGHGHIVTNAQLGNTNLPSVIINRVLAATGEGIGAARVESVTFGGYNGVAGHTHGIEPLGDHQHVVTVPPFFVLARVMFDV